VAAETITFKIGEDEYEVPDIADLDMDEWQVMYDYAGLVLDDFAPADDEDEEAARIRRLRQPAFTRALLHIGYQRQHPEAKPDAVRELTGRAKLIPVLAAIDAASEDEDDADPPASTPEPAPLLPKSSGGSSESGPPASETSSDEPDEHPVATGTTG
jgi:hypothetical protein